MFKLCHQRYLKIKIKSLSAESKIIRLEEQRCFGNVTLLNSLHRHRTCDVRAHSRANFIAYAYLRGRTLESIEGTGCIPVSITIHAGKMVKKFGTKEAYEGFRAWCPNPVIA